MHLTLRPFRDDDEVAARAAHHELAADNFQFLLFWDESMTWSDYLAQQRRYGDGRDLDALHVRAAFLAAEVEGALVGRVSVRFSLNDFLATVGGHIGYGVVRAHRRKGYASEMLRQSLVLARAEGVRDVLVTCTDTNRASAAVIEGCGGEFEKVVRHDESGETYRRYWFR